MNWKLLFVVFLIVFLVEVTSILLFFGGAFCMLANYGDRYSCRVVIGPSDGGPVWPVIWH